MLYIVQQGSVARLEKRALRPRLLSGRCRVVLSADTLCPLRGPHGGTRTPGLRWPVGLGPAARGALARLPHTREPTRQVVRQRLPTDLQFPFTLLSFIYNRSEFLKISFSFLLLPCKYCVLSE